jgi:hypothetical protein
MVIIYMIDIITDETISLIYKHTQKEKNKKKLENIINNLLDISLRRINPYLYSIMAVLILIFVINCVQFYYYTNTIIRTLKI